MKKLFQKTINAIQNAAYLGYRAVMRAVSRLAAPVRPALANSRGEGYVDTAVFS